MSSSLKLGLLALVSSAVAVPHYGHSRFHKPSGGYGTGAPYPTGGWPGSNSTAIAPTGTGASPEKTTTIDEFETSTTTLTSTIFIKPTPDGGEESESEPSSATPADVYPTGGNAAKPTGDGGKCAGPETIYVTATNQVTVTVTAGQEPSSAPAEAPASSPEAAPSSEAAPTGEYEAPTPSESFVFPSPSAAEEKPSISIPQKGVETDAPAPAPSSTKAQVEEPSSATPASKPSSAPSFSGSKRGLAYNDASLCKSFEGKASWAYSWGSTPQGDLPSGISFVPMPWVKNEDAEKWLKHVDEAVASGSTAVMGFNEPDHPAQANMLPGEACQRWAEYMNPIASSHPDVTIIGPSVTNAGDKANWGLDWYKNFMSACPDAQWHAANIHFYDIWQEGEGMSSTMYRFQKHIEDAVKLTGKKVWVTEFGLNPGSSSADTAKFLKQAMEYMDGSGDVQGYSYFMVGSGENQLISGQGLSEIGQVYAAN